MADVKERKRIEGNEDWIDKGFTLKQMLDILEKESAKLDISDYDRKRLSFLQGFLNGAFSTVEDRNNNIASAVTICKRIKLRDTEPASDKVN